MKNSFISGVLLHAISPADVQRPPGVAGERSDLPGDELDCVAVEDPQSGEAGGHDLPEWRIMILIMMLNSKWSRCTFFT